MLFSIVVGFTVIYATYYIRKYIKLTYVDNIFNVCKQKVVDFDYAGTWYKTKFLCRYMWPDDRIIQIKTVVCFALLITGNVMNMVVPLFGKWMVDKLSTEKHFVTDVLSMTFGFLCLQGNAYFNRALSDVRSMIHTSVRQYTEARVKVDIYSHLLHMPYTWYTEQNGRMDSSDYFHQSAYTFQSFPDLLVFSLLPAFVDVFIATTFFVHTFDLQLTLMVGTVAFLYYASTKWMDYLISRYDNEFNDDIDYYGMSCEALKNFETVKYFCNEKLELNNFRKAIAKKHEVEKKQQNSCQINLSVRSLLTDGLLMLGTFLMAYRRAVDSTELTAGDYVLFTNFFYQFTEPMWSLEGAIEQIKYALEQAGPLIKLFDTPLEGEGGTLKGVEISGGLKLDNVSFSYVEGSEVLHNVTFEVPEGKTVALVGPTGSGKSTVVRLLYRFLEPTEGAILISDTNIKQYDIYEYRRQIGVVPQDCALFNKSIQYNLNYANWDADEEEIEKATRAAQIHRMIEKKPEKLKEKVGERGMKLSGGEKQRMAIARTILKNPKYLFMDEATSSLDTITERQIQKALTDLTKNKTCVIVAHRLSTIVHADNIVVLKDGRVLEQGNHKKLLENNGLYAKMWNLQQGGDFNQ